MENQEIQNVQTTQEIPVITTRKRGRPKGRSRQSLTVSIDIENYQWIRSLGKRPSAIVNQIITSVRNA